jgi:hypothetical protein
MYDGEEDAGEAVCLDRERQEKGKTEEHNKPN